MDFKNTDYSFSKSSDSMFLRHTNHTLIFKFCFISLYYLRRTCIAMYQETNEKHKTQRIPVAWLNWFGVVGRELVREREILAASCFLISEITLHRMNSASLLFTTLYLPSKDVHMPLVSSCFLRNLRMKLLASLPLHSMITNY